jgi:hypothetical protein
MKPKDLPKARSPEAKRYRTFLKLILRQKQEIASLKDTIDEMQEKIDQYEYALGIGEEG